MEFRELSQADCEQIRQWRNQVPEALRTPFALTKEMQEQFYKEIICNRNSRSRFWGIWIKDKISSNFIGMCGLENVQWENSTAEISIILNSDYKGKGFGTKVIDILLNKAFNELKFETIFGECYQCNPSINFWEKIVKKYNGTDAHLPKRKYWNGKFYDSMYFIIDKEDYNVTDNT